MTMSEHEARVLEELEAAFHPAPPRIPKASWARVSPGTRLVVALVRLPVALLVVLLGVYLNSALGVLVAIAGFLLTVAVVHAAADAIARGGARCLGWTRTHLAPPPEYDR